MGCQQAGICRDDSCSTFNWLPCLLLLLVESGRWESWRPTLAAYHFSWDSEIMWLLVPQLLTLEIRHVCLKHSLAKKPTHKRCNRKAATEELSVATTACQWEHESLLLDCMWVHLVSRSYDTSQTLAAGESSPLHPQQFGKAYWIGCWITECHKPLCWELSFTFSLNSDI